MSTDMNHYDVRRLALVLAVQAEIDGMKAHNQVLDRGHPARYGQAEFDSKAEELRNLAASHDEQL